MAGNAVNGEYWASYYNSHVACVADPATTVYTAALSSDKRSLTLTEVADKTINKGQAVLLKSTGSNITLTRTIAEGTGDFSDNSLRGKDAATAVPTDEGTVYTLAVENGKLGFYHYTGTTLAARKAYLAITGGSEAGIRFDFEEATGMEPCTKDDNVQDTMYDLSGRRVSKPGKGLYIMGGKKVFIQ